MKAGRGAGVAADATDETSSNGSFSLQGVRFDAAPIEPGLYSVATPIGNLEDVTIRALRVLAAADHVYCEDTRITRRLLSRYAINARLSVYDEHRAERARPVILEAVRAGRSVALVSDAGTPLISDPGYKLVREMRAADLPVFAVPGPSALTAAASISGLPTDRLLFIGFLPSRAGARDRAIESVADTEATLIMFEAPGRVGATLSALAARLGDKEAAVMRELTKLHEEVVFAPLRDLAERYRSAAPRGECVIVVRAASATSAAPVDGAALDEALTDALKSASLRDAVAAVSARLGLPRRSVYDRALALRDKADDADDG